MGAGVNSTKLADEPRKRLNRLRSVKVTNLDKFRLSMKRAKSRLSQEIALPDDSMEMDSKQKQSPTSKFHDSPNYMKATSCFNARSGSSQLNPGGTSIARRSTKGMKRMYSLKRLRKLPSLKSEISSANHLGNAELASRGDDFEGTIQVAPPKLKLIRSGSIKITRVRSLKLSRRRLSKSRLDQASNFTTDDESAEELSSESDLQKTMNSSVSAPSLKPIRTLYKIPSLRSKRRSQPVKKHSRFAESNASHFDRATCSWALKSSKIPQASDHDSGKWESESQLIGRVCPYTYCSLHGHQHSPSPPLKGFIATKRRLLKKQRSIRLKRKPKTEATCYRDVSRMKQSMQEHADPLMSETEGSNEEMFVEIYAKLSDVSTPGSSVGSCCTGSGAEVRGFEFGGESRKADSDSVESGELHKQSSAADSTDILLDTRKYANMWKLIYKHLSVPGTEAIKGKEENADTTDIDGFDCNLNQDHRDENQDVNLDNQVAGSERPEFNQAEAIEFVQQAVDEILQLDERSPLFPIISPNTVLNHVGICRNAEEPVDPAKEDAFRAHDMEDEPPKELKDINQANSGAIVPEKEDLNRGQQPIRQRSKGFEKLRKMIITAKFVKAVEKLRRINPRKPRFLSPEAQSKVEKVQLRHLSMDGRKNTEEWMLDFALQQVIAKLAPAQQRRVGLLVKAFERVAPETSIKRDSAKTPPASHSAPTDNVQEERSIAIDLDSAGSCDIIIQDLDSSVATADDEDHSHPGMIVSAAKILLEVDDNRSQSEVSEDSGKQELKSESVYDTAKPGKEVFSTTRNENEDQDKGSDNKPSDLSPCEDTNFLFDKEKFTNVWHMVYRQFIAQEATASGEKKADGKEQDESISASSNTESSGSSPGQLDMKHVATTDGIDKQEVNQADAIQLVQEAIDELLHLHEQLSDQQTPKSCRVPEQQNKLCSLESKDHSLELKDTPMKEQEREETDNQKALQRQTSKPLSKLKKLILSAKFIKTMEKLRNIRTCKTEDLSSQGSPGAEKICLRRSSTDERRNGEEWMLDNTLQQVISKLAPAQQKRVALLTQAFETFTPELEQMSRRYSRVKMQPEICTASTTKQKNVEDKFDDNVPKSDDPVPEDASVVLASIKQQEDRVDKVQDANFHVDIKSEFHDQTNTKGCPPCSSDNTLTEYKKELEFKTKHHSHQEQTLIDSQEDEHKFNAPRYVLSEGKYSKMWQLIYRHITSNSSAESENQTTEIRAKEGQYDDTINVQTRDATFEKLEITQSDAIKLVQEALDGILQQPLINSSKEKNEEGNKSDQNAFQGYSKWKRAIICSRFVKAMEKMQKLYTHKKRSPYNPLISDQEAEIVHLRQCLIDERSNSEVWMLDYALRQAVAKLAPVQQRKVALLIEAFETVGPNTALTAGNEDSKEETSLESCQDSSSEVAGDKALSELNAELIGDGDTQSQDIGKGTNDGGNNIFLDGKKYSSMWRLIYKHIKSGIPNADANHNPEAEQIPTETDVYGPASDVETLDEETPCDSEWSSTDNENAEQNSPSGDTELQQKDAIKLVEEAVNEILDMQVQSCDDQSTDTAEEKAIEEDKAREELPRSYSVMSKVIMCKKFIKAMEKMKKSKPRVKRKLPQQSEFCAESVRLRAQRMDDKNCEEWMLDYALQQVIGKLAPTQKKKVSLLVEAFERVNPPPDSTRHHRFNVVA